MQKHVNCGAFGSVDKITCHMDLTKKSACHNISRRQQSIEGLHSDEVFNFNGFERSQHRNLAGSLCSQIV